MPSPQILMGSFVSTGNPITIPIAIMDVNANIHFATDNETNFASVANPGVVKRAHWQTGMAAGSWIGVQNSDGAATDETTGAATNGFTIIDTQNTLQLEAAKVGTALTAANPAVATMVAHGYSVGDIVRITNTTGMLQIAGMDFTITAVGGANNFTLGYLDASGFAAPATAITARRLRYDNIWFPRNRYVTKITQALQAVVTLSVTHGYVVGQSVSFRIPAAFGMVQLDGLTGEIVAISTANNTVTVDIDTTAFTAFAFPTSVNNDGLANMYMAGLDSGLVPTGAEYQNTGFRAMHLGSDVAGALNDQINWVARFGF